MTDAPHTPPHDIMDVDDVLASFPDLKAGERIILKLGCASSEQETRNNLDPQYTEALRALRRESLAEARLNADLMRGA